MGTFLDYEGNFILPEDKKNDFIKDALANKELRYEIFGF